jgi:hypothetical protein
MTIILRKFDIKYIGYSSFILIIGNNNTGKSTISKHILHYYNDIPVGMVITQFKNKHIYKYIPQIFIHENYDKKIIKNIIKKQKKNIDNDDYDNRSFLIIDQYLNQKDKYFNMLCTNYKNLSLLYILELTYIDNISNIIINNIDFLFILREELQLNRRKIYNLINYYLNIEFSVFCKLLDDYTHNYNFLVLSLNSKSNFIEDKLFWYKSDIIDNKYKSCCIEAWNYNNENLIKDYNINTNIKILNHQFFI